MYVSVIIDPGSIESGQALVNLLVHFGFEKRQKSCWENVRLAEVDLSSLKREIDRMTDYYDKVRIYQYPLEGSFVITELDKKNWKKTKINTNPKKDK